MYASRVRCIRMMHTYIHTHTHTQLQRVKGTPPYVDAWLQHQRRDAFWKHGSVCEDFAAIQCPCYVVGSYSDGYTNAVCITHVPMSRSFQPCATPRGSQAHTSNSHTYVQISKHPSECALLRAGPSPPAASPRPTQRSDRPVGAQLPGR